MLTFIKLHSPKRPSAKSVCLMNTQISFWQMMIERNVTRRSFKDKLQEIIDRYNSGDSINENYFDDLMAFVEKMKEDEIRAAREGLTEEELELFDLLKKEKLTKEEEQ